MDNELDEAMSMSVQTHLSLCVECGKVCEDFAVILDSCLSENPSEIIPPNSQALWCRINNIIESEVKHEPVVLPEPVKGRFGRSFTFSQVGAGGPFRDRRHQSLSRSSASGIIMKPAGDDYTSRSSTSQTTFEKVLSKVGLVETPQQARGFVGFGNSKLRSIIGTNASSQNEYQWDKKMRDAFDRNLNEIDQAVNEYTLILEKDPQDDLSGEMLDSTMNEKMNLLREFSEL